jgi:hypothetical protein
VDEGQPTPDDAGDGPVPHRGVRPAGAHRLTGEDSRILPRLSGRRHLLILVCAVLAVALAAAVGVAVVGRGGPPAAGSTGAIGNAAGGGAGVAGPSIGDDPTGTAWAGPTPSAPPSRSATRSPSRTPGARSGTNVAAPGTGASASDAPSASPSASTVWTSLTVTATRALTRGQSVQTNRTSLAVQDDGNMVIVDETGTIRWRAGTSPNGDKAVFQGDGNFVVYDVAMRPLWSSHTDGHGGAVLVLQADGDVCVVYQGARLWCAGTAH